jgi:hypothetical protein
VRASSRKLHVLAMLLAGLAGGACATRNIDFDPADGPPEWAPEAPRDAGGLKDSAAADRAPAPAGVDLRKGLRGYWKLDDGAGSSVVHDSSGNGHDGVLEDLDPTTAWTDGRYGGALLISGDTGGVRVDMRGALDNLAAYTIAAWILRPASHPGRYESVISRQQGDLDYEAFNLAVVDDHLRAYRSLTASGVPGRIDAPADLPLGAWIHVAAVWDGQKLRLYQDGLEIGSGAHDFPLQATTKPLFLGTNENADGDRDSLAGSLDEVLIYDVALSPQAMRALAMGAPPRN